MGRDAEIATKKALLEEAKNYFGFSSIEQLAVKLGFKEATAATWRSRGMSSTAIAKYEAIKSNDSMNKAKKQLEKVQINFNPNWLCDEDQNIVSISYYPNINAAGGYGAINGDEKPELLSVSRAFLFTMFGLSSFNGLDVIRVVGDSMEPYIPNGETILLQRTTQARNNQIVVARIGDEVYVKRLLKDPMGEWIKLTSENQYYPDIDIKKKDMDKVEIIGVVCGRFRPF